MHHKRMKSRKRARCYSGQLGPRDSGGDGWRKGNFASRFRVRERGRRMADMDEVAEFSVDQLCIRVILNDADPTAPGIELYRIPVEVPACKDGAEFGTGLRGPGQHSVLEMARRMLKDEALVMEVRARHGDVEVRLDVMLDEVRRLKGLSAVTPVVEGIVSFLAERFAETPGPVATIWCQGCRREVPLAEWDEFERLCHGCSWDFDEDR
jgi:hypothetical protein